MKKYLTILWEGDALEWDTFEEALKDAQESVLSPGWGVYSDMCVEAGETPCIIMICHDYNVENPNWEYYASVDENGDLDRYVPQ